jgi:8-oxo-dGTP pyrophosphatase MutT (NUDIX family)
VSARVSQAGGIVFRTEDDRLRVLLVRSKKDPAIWVFPKGHIEPGEMAAATAIRETWEEAGVEGELDGPVGAPLEFQSGAEPVSVQYFLIRARTERPSPEGRDKQWLPIDTALETLAFENAREKLREARLLFSPRPVEGHRDR